MARADDQARPARHDAADELCGVDLILECERAASRRNPRDRDPKRWTNTRCTLPLHCGTRTKPRRLGADLRTIDPNQKPAGQLWSAGFLLWKQQPLYRRILSAGMSYGSAEQPPFCAGVEMGLNPIAVPLQSATPFRSWISI